RPTRPRCSAPGMRRIPSSVNSAAYPPKSRSSRQRANSVNRSKMTARSNRERKRTDYWSTVLPRRTGPIRGSLAPQQGGLKGQAGAERHGDLVLSGGQGRDAPVLGKDERKPGGGAVPVLLKDVS